MLVKVGPGQHQLWHWSWRIKNPCLPRRSISNVFPLLQLINLLFPVSLKMQHVNNYLIGTDARIYAFLKWVFIGSNDGLSYDRNQAIIWNNAGLLLNWSLRTLLSDVWMHLIDWQIDLWHRLLLINDAKNYERQNCLHLIFYLDWYSYVKNQSKRKLLMSGR